MEAIFTLPYSEYETINDLRKRLAQPKGNYFYIPTSRQQKDVDFIVHNLKSNRCLRFQVKSSRSYSNEPRKLKSGKEIYRNNLWFNNFIKTCKKSNADYYILFGLYPVYKTTRSIHLKLDFWKNLIMCFSKQEMIEILKEAKTIRENKEERFFGFGFNSENEIYGTRGFKDKPNLSKFLIQNKIKDLKKSIV